MTGPIYFNSKISEWAWLSNFAPSPIIDRKKAIWPTAEHAYQGQKTHDAEWKNHIRGAVSPWIARKLGRNCPIREDWDKVKVQMMTKVVREKFRQNFDLRILLLQTEDRKIVHEAPWDGFWGSGPYSNGLNVLGKVIMEIRDEIREEEAKAYEEKQTREV